MPVSPTYPGVYVQEVPSGVRTIVGVSTSTGMFIGTSNGGAIEEPVQCLSYLDFTRNFSEDPAGGSLAQYVKLFFLNGGTNCYVMRIANGAGNASVTLQNEAKSPVLELHAKKAGLVGETVRAVVTYAGPQPEATFNLDLFEMVTDITGRRVRQNEETWKNLSMDPNSPLFAPTVLTQGSRLVSTVDVAPAGANGFSLSGRPIATGSFTADLSAFMGAGAGATANRFQISVGGSPFVDVDLRAINVGNPGATAALIRTAIESAFTNAGILGINVNVTFSHSATSNTERLRIEPTGATSGDVYIRPGTQSGAQRDLAVPLMLGTAQGGLEVSGNADRRPAPNGITFRAADPANVIALGDLTQSAITTLILEVWNPKTGTATPVAPAMNLNAITTAGGDPVFVDAFAGSPNGNRDGIREKLQIIAQRVNTFQPPPPAVPSDPPLVWPWRAEVWGYRLALIPQLPLSENFLSTALALGGPPASQLTNNVRYYSVGAGGNSIGQQTSAGAPASDGTPPLATDYDAAYQIIDREVDVFNLMVLPPDSAAPVATLYGNASVFCQQRRAFLLMDPPSSWTNAQEAAAGVAGLRVGLVKDYTAISFPRITITSNGKNVNIGPAGAIAGLCARIDASRGVWKAPAGTEADLRGVVGVEYKLSDAENGVINPRAINTIRIFPNGIVNWGARTNDGDDNFASEYKYIPIRRLALYIEESLYRGLKWVVFEPNDEPLYAQIRLNVGAFMHDLFKQGAFQGQTPRDAYFVKCDTETTTDNHRNLGIVNIMVGFAPLKPAEFVILYLQQMAGQVQV
jgi:phage tail sheath protein FI